MSPSIPPPPSRREAAPSSLPERFGRYVLVRRLREVRGGEICLALQRSAAGVEKLIIVKRLDRVASNDIEQVEALLREGRIAGHLAHPNVIQGFDTGEHDGRYFISMEYVYGHSLRSILDTLSARDEGVPIEHALSIGITACAAISYAHERRSIDGAPLGLTHGALSPDSVWISYAGEVKIADFGAVSEASHSDRTADVVALGALLFELAAGRPLSTSAAFEGLAGRPGLARPSPRQGHDYSPALDAIVMKAIAKRREARFDSAGDFQVALEHFARQQGIATSQVSLGGWMDRLFRDRVPGQELREARRAFDLVMATTPTTTSAAAPRTKPPAPPRPAPPTPLPPAARPTQLRDLEMALAAPSIAPLPATPAEPIPASFATAPRSTPPPPPVAQPPSPPPPALSAKPLSAPPPPPRMPTIPGASLLSSLPPPASHTLPPAPLSAAPKPIAQRYGSAAATLLLGVATGTMLGRLSSNKEEIAPVAIETAVVSTVTKVTEAPRKDERGSVEFVTDPPGAAIWIDGDLATSLTPSTIDHLPLGRTLHVRLTREGFVPYSGELTLLPEQTQQKFSQRLENSTFKLRLKVDARRYALYVDGLFHGSLVVDGLTVGEDHKIAVSAQGRVGKVIFVRAEQGTDQELEVKLAPARWIR